MQQPLVAAATCFFTRLMQDFPSGLAMPAHAENLSGQTSLDGKSTGQRMMSHLAEVEVPQEVTHMLLDEWDANLDTCNTARIDERPNQAARSKVIFDICH